MRFVNLIAKNQQSLSTDALIGNLTLEYIFILQEILLHLQTILVFLYDAGSKTSQVGDPIIKGNIQSVKGGYATASSSRRTLLVFL
jgi:hypothetical protein